VWVLLLMCVGLASAEDLVPGAEDSPRDTQAPDTEGAPAVKTPPPKAVHQVSPRYPAAGLALDLPEVDCTVRFYIDEEGVPYGVAPLDCADVFFESVHDVAFLWRFEPWVVDGQATKSEFALKIKFRTKDTATEPEDPESQTDEPGRWVHERNRRAGERNAVWFSLLSLLPPQDGPTPPTWMGFVATLGVRQPSMFAAGVWLNGNTREGTDADPGSLRLSRSQIWVGLDLPGLDPTDRRWLAGLTPAVGGGIGAMQEKRGDWKRTSYRWTWTPALEGWVAVRGGKPYWRAQVRVSRDDFTHRMLGEGGPTWQTHIGFGLLGVP
jgi:hypothetical protein